MSLTDDMQLNKAKKAWKPSSKNPRHRPKAVEDEENDPEEAKTQQLFRCVRSILNKLTPQMFQQLMKQVTEHTIDTEERLKGVIDLIFEKAISEPILSVAYANMCRFLMGLKVPITGDKLRVVNFRKLLLNRCQKEFEKDKDDVEIFEKMQKELDAALGEEEKQRLKEELDDSKDRARRRSLGNIRFLGELFKLKMLTEVIMHDCIVKLFKNQDKVEESLEELCILLTTTGKDLDFEKAKPRMDQYFKQLEVIIKEKRTSFKVRFMLQDVLDLRRDNWVPRRGDQGPTTIVRPFPGSVSGNRPATSTLNRFSALQQPSRDSSLDYTEEERLDYIIRMHISRGQGDRFDRRDDRQDNRRNDRPADRRDYRNKLPVTKHSFRQEESSCKKDRRKPVNTVCHVPRATAIIEEYLHVMEEALQCAQEMNSAQLLFVFVRKGLESTLERSAIDREHMGLLLHQLIKTGMMPTQQYYKGLQEILEVAEDMAIDIPLFWLYLAELITPMLYEGGIPMGQLFKEISKSLVPLGKASDLLVHILILLRKGMGHIKVGAMWKEAGLSWKDFLPEDEDVTKFVTAKKVEFTLGDESERGKKEEVNATEMSKQLDRLIQDKADNARIFDWIKANLEEQQTSSNTFVRALMTCICQSAIICENPYKVDSEKINHRAKLLQKYLEDEQKELQALYALQALVVEMEQPANLLRMFFDILYDEDVIKEEAFFKWESSKDPAEQQGKGVALRSVTAFFTWLRDAEYESDNS